MLYACIPLTHPPISRTCPWMKARRLTMSQSGGRSQRDHGRETRGTPAGAGRGGGGGGGGSSIIRLYKSKLPLALVCRSRSLTRARACSLTHRGVRRPCVDCSAPHRTCRQQEWREEGEGSSMSRNECPPVTVTVWLGALMCLLVCSSEQMAVRFWVLGLKV